MPRKLIEITATVAHECQRFGDAPPFTLIMEGTMDETPATDGANEDGHRNGNGRPSRIKLKGKSEGGEWNGESPEEKGRQSRLNRLEPYVHGSYRFYGEWRNYTNQRTGVTEKQFHWQTFVPAKPHSRAGVVAYLEQAPQIGRILAGRLFERFGGKAVDILADQPEVAAAAVDRLSDEAAVEAAAWLKREEALRDCTIELVDLLQGRGFPKATTKAAVKEFGNRAADVIRANPYAIMRFRGCGFKRADALYLDLGHPAGKLKRQALCAWNHIARNCDGDTWHYRKAVEIGLAGAIAGADVRIESAIELATRGRLLATQWTNGVDGPMDWDGTHCWVADGKKARNEERVASYVVQAMQEKCEATISCEFPSLSEHQLEVLMKIFGCQLAILGGSPGTGKTFTVAQLIRAIGMEIGYDQIACAAPTGKAAVRLTEAMAAYNIPLVARTIHSLLKVQSGGDGGWSFTFNQSNPLPFKVIVVDEASMIDTDLAASLFAARARGTRVVIVGDVNQLPPVGHGAPLRDMIAAGVPYGELKEIRRNSGAIVEACAAIRDGKAFQCDRESNLRLAACNGASQQKGFMLDVIDLEAKAFGVNPVWGVQILCAVNKKSELSRRDLNAQLQQHLNPNPKVKDSPFRLSDKVVCTKNSWLPLVEVAGNDGNGRVKLVDNDDNLTINEKNQVYVANGELGEVVRVEPGFFHVQLTAPRRLVVVPRGKAMGGDDSVGDENGEVEESTGTGCDWDLGYALSVHKSQGSEWPVVIVMVDDSGGAKRVCSREWIYTAISRAKQCCVLVGKMAVAQGFTKRTAIDKRRTFLAQKIKEGMRAI